MIPLFRVTNMRAAIDFYTNILDFRITEPDATADDFVLLLENQGAHLMLTILEGDQKIGIAANIVVSGIDNLFTRYKNRGLDQSEKRDSPVHLGPVDQTWGTREFYVTDPDGNTLRFVQVSE